MTISPDYYGYNGYGDYSYGQSRRSTDAQDRRRRWITAGVAVLGLATFAVSFGSPTLIEWPVWFSALAAVIAALGLLSGQDERGWVVAALAALGFLVAVSRLIVVGDGGWALGAIVAFNALQAVAAVTALWLTDPPRDPEGDGGDYRAYAEYVQAYQAYAMQQYQQGGQPAQVMGEATAQGYAASGAYAVPQNSHEQMHARYAGYGNQSSPSAERVAKPVGPTFINPGMPRMGEGTSAVPSQQRSTGATQENPSN